MIDRLETLRKINVNDIQGLIETKHSDVIKPEMQEYILQLDAVNRILKTNRLSVRQTIDVLRRQYPKMTFVQARSLYYDAMDYFYMDDGPSARSWDLVYAEQFEDLKTLAIAANKLDVAFKCACKAHELRTKERESLDYHWKAPTYLVNINVKPEDLGYTSQKLADIAKRSEDRKYREMIMSLETTDAEKRRLLADAGLQYEEVKEEDIPDEQ